MRTELCSECGRRPRAYGSRLCEMCYEAINGMCEPDLFADRRANAASAMCGRMAARLEAGFAMAEGR